MSFLAGRTAMCLDKWKELTNNNFVLGLAKGICLDFVQVPSQWSPAHELTMSLEEMSLVDLEVNKMLSKGAILKVQPVSGHFISNIFLTPKKSGGMRPVINLKALNRFLEPVHFKMEHLLTILPLLERGSYMTSLDLKDAYFSLPIAKAFRKYLRFSWRGELYEFQCLCFGLSPAPYFFTKVMKPPFSLLRREGIRCSYYIDDSFYTDRDPARLRRSSERALHLLESLGFQMNLQKSSFNPSTTLIHLGFVIDTLSMKISLPEDKLSRIVQACASVIDLKKVSIRHLASIIGLLVSSLLAVRYGRLHYRHLEFERIDGLKRFGSFDASIELHENAILDLTWWRDNVRSHNGREIDDILKLKQYQDDLYTDASSSGWGAVLYRNAQDN